MKTGKYRKVLAASSLVLAGMFLGSCKKPVAEQAPEEETAPPPAATPAPRIAPPPATPVVVLATPAPDPLAPPGVFFLLQKTSVTTDEGIVGLKPGQVLQEISPGTYQAGTYTIQLRPEQVTNNLRVARQFALADAASQAALRQALQATPVPRATTPAPRISTAPSRSDPPRAQPAPPSSNGLSGGAKIGGGDTETSNRKNVHVDSSGRQYWRDSRGAIRYDF